MFLREGMHGMDAPQQHAIRAAADAPPYEFQRGETR